MKTVVHPGRTYRIEPQRPRRTAANASTHLAWFAAGSVLGFAVPFLFGSVLDLQHDVYYAVYFAFALAFLGAYARATGVNVRALFQGQEGGPGRLLRSRLRESEVFARLRPGVVIRWRSLFVSAAGCQRQHEQEQRAPSATE